MGSSDKALRTPPARIFENYVLVEERGNGLTNVPITEFTSLIHFKNGVGDPFVKVPIGFQFKCDTTADNVKIPPVYDQMFVSDNGYIALIGTQNALSDLAFLTTLINNPNTFSNNVYIQSAAWNSQGALLCPWFQNLTSLANTPESCVIPVVSAKDIDLMKKGLIAWPFLTDPYGGVWIKQNDYDPKLGYRTIVRWVSQAVNFYKITFECVLYPSGRYEFRYGEKSQSGGGSSTTSATVGAFMPANKTGGATGPTRFREFLTPQDTTRVKYSLGGYIYDPTYADSGHNYRISLDMDQDWPGPSTFVMLPPALRRKVLPRAELRGEDSALDHSVFNGAEPYDDRRTVSYVIGVVNYPTTLPRFYGNTAKGITERQNLFSGDFTVTSSAVPSAVEPWLAVRSTPIDPYTENRNFENGHITDISASIANTGLNLKQPLLSKDVIKLVMPINKQTKFLELTSSVISYDFVQKQFIPIATASMRDSKNEIQRFSEDYQLFSPLGIYAQSGTNPTSPGTTDQSITKMNTLYDPYTLVQVNMLDANIQGLGINADSAFDPGHNKTFSIPINAPFLLEKIGIELPFEAGSGWFNDRTRTYAPNGLSASNSGFDMGGPSIVFSLFNEMNFRVFVEDGQVLYDPLPSFRELIASGTILPSTDLTSSFETRILPDPGDGSIRGEIQRSGFSTYGSTPSIVVTPTNGTFSGSISALIDATVSNGVTLILTASGGDPADIDGFMNTPTLLMSSQPDSSFDIFDIKFGYFNAYGRSKAGAYGITGRSPFGKELITTTPRAIPNPFYTSEQATIDAISNDFLAAPVDNVTWRAAVPLETNNVSPYLILPTDRLCLSLHKTRPVRQSDINFAGTYATSHDVCIPTGTVYLTLYGSYLKEANEYHPGLNQPLHSPALRNVIDNEPVLDQFSVENFFQNSTTIFDHYMTGSLVTITPTGIVTGERGRVFHNVEAKLFGEEQTPFPGDRISEYTILEYTLALNLRFSQFASDNERYYDSLLPRIDEIVKIDGNLLSGANGGLITLDPNQVQTALPSPFNSAGPKAVFYFDFLSGSGRCPIGFVGSICDNKWTKAYPFEQRYSNLIRFTDVVSSFACNLDVSGAEISKTVTNAYFWFQDFTNQRILAGGSAHDAATYTFTWVDSVNRNPQLRLFGASSADLALQTKSDAIKALFGIGDVNTMQISGSSGSCGTTCFPSFRVYDSDPADVPSRELGFAAGPSIRGWKYGILNGLPQNTKCCWRINRFGQFRDMLEQRQNSKFFYETTVGRSSQRVSAAPVSARFVNMSGLIVAPESTSCSNLSFEITSSVPYFDGDVRNR